MSALQNMQPVLSVFTLFCCVSCIYAAFLSHDQKRVFPNLGIHGGGIANLHQYPPAAWLQIFSKNAKGKLVTSQCGGTLISKDYVLTAAHCLETNFVKRKHNVVLGLHDWNNATDEDNHQVFEVTKANFIIHRSYNASKTYFADIALIKLPYSANIKANKVEIAKLPRLSDASKLYVDQSVKGYGWGVQANTGKVSDILRYYESKIISLADCGRSIITNTDNICTSGKDARNNNIGVCGGDSGGPIVTSNDGVLIGVVSRSATDCTAGKPSVFINVGTYLNWIKQNSNAVIN